MSPIKVSALPSPAALASYNISENGFLTAEVPLSRLSHDYYQPWEAVIEILPELLESRQIRWRVDDMPVLDTSHLHSEPEWRRAYSILAIIAQAYIWQGPEPAQVSDATLVRARSHADDRISDYHLQYPSLSLRLLSTLRSIRSRPMQHSISGIGDRSRRVATFQILTILLLRTRTPDLMTSRGSSSSPTPWRRERVH